MVLAQSTINFGYAMIDLAETLLETDDIRVYQAALTAKYADAAPDYEQLLHAIRWATNYQGEIPAIDATVVERIAGKWVWQGLVQPYFLDQPVSLVLAVLGALQARLWLGAFVECRYQGP